LLISLIAGSLRKQGVGVNTIVQQNQEFSIQNEDFPALPGYKGCSSQICYYKLSVDLVGFPHLPSVVPICLIVYIYIYILKRIVLMTLTFQYQLCIFYSLLL
jgi:hypothetical protein